MDGCFRLVLVRVVAPAEWAVAGGDGDFEIQLKKFGKSVGVVRCSYFFFFKSISLRKSTTKAMPTEMPASFQTVSS